MESYIFSGLIAVIVLIFGFLLNRVFDKIDALDESCATKHALDRVEEASARKDHCVTVQANFNDKFDNVHKRLDGYHNDNKEDHKKLEDTLAKVYSILDGISTCVTKLSANVKCQ